MAMMLLAECVGCGYPFVGNPRRVPTINKQPVCRGCMAAINAHRVEMGLEPWPVPADAYEPAQG